MDINREIESLRNELCITKELFIGLMQDYLRAKNKQITSDLIFQVIISIPHISDISINNNELFFIYTGRTMSIFVYDNRYVISEINGIKYLGTKMCTELAYEISKRLWSK